MSLPGGWKQSGGAVAIESGQAFIFRVRRPEDEREYALKRLKNPSRAERFAREISVMRELSSKGVPVPPVVEDGVDARGRPYFVMPWYEQGSVEGWMQAGSDLIGRLDLLLQIVDALQLCHAAEVAHRDLKPANILLSDDGRALLADLGLARDCTDDRLTAVDEGVGSRFYIAPENESGINPSNDQRPADAYAFGKVCWSVLTGRTPLSREQALDPPNRLATLLEDTRFGPLDSLLLALLDPDPRSRLSDWGDVHAELGRVRSSLVVGELDVEDHGDGDEPAFLDLLDRLRSDAATAASAWARNEDNRRHERWNEIVGAISRRAALSVDGDIERFNQAGTDVGVVVRRSVGGPHVERLCELPPFADLDLSALPQWARGTGAAVLFTIEGGFADLPRRVYLALFALPDGDHVRFLRTAFCYPEGRQDFLALDVPPPFTRTEQGPRMSLDGAITSAEAFVDETASLARTLWTSFVAQLVEGGAVEATIGL